LLHQDLGFILLRSAPQFNRFLLLFSVMAAVILLSWLVHAGPEKWLASQLKSLLAGTQNRMVSMKSLISDRFAGSTLKSASPVVPSGVPATASTVAPSPETMPMPVSGPQLTKSSDTL